MSLKKVKDIKAGKENDTSAGIAIMFTGCDDDLKKSAALFKKHGVKVVHSFEEATHVCADRIKRTTKFLTALSSGKKFVSNQWVKECVSKKEIVGKSLYLKVI